MVAHLPPFGVEEAEADMPGCVWHGSSKIPTGSDVRRLFVGESQSTSTAMPSGGEELHFPSHRDVDRCGRHNEGTDEA